jgi:hypothetical protein
MKFKALPVSSLEDATVDFEQLQSQQASFGTFAMGGRTGALAMLNSTAVPLDTTSNLIEVQSSDPNGLIHGGAYNVPATGYYFASGHVRITTTAVSVCAVYVTVNGTQVLEGDVCQNVPSATAAWGGSVSGVIGLIPAGAQIGLAAFINIAGSLYVANSWPLDNRLTVFRIG